MHVFKRFWNDESGAELVEWAVVTIILLVATAGLLIALRGQIIDIFQRTFTTIGQDPPESYDP